MPISAFDTPKTIEFWYDFASPYSYLAAERIGSLAKPKGIVVSWHPFLLGPIFANQGWDNSPFNIYKAKGNYMWRDMERSTTRYGLPFSPDKSVFPMNGLLAARCALCFSNQEDRERFTVEVFRAEFVLGKNIASIEIITDIIKALGHDAADITSRTQSAEIKQKLFTNTENAKNKGVFGAPSFVTRDGELFWGDDRLEQALDWRA